MSLISCLRRLALAALLALSAAGPAGAQAWPDRPIRLLVPIAAGSVTDVILRAAAPELSARLGQPVVIENRTGASGIVGAQACARATADGYTACAVYHSTMSFNPLLFERLPYDPVADFAPVTSLFFLTEVMAVNAAMPVRSVAELRSFARESAQGLTFGTLGEGSFPDLLLRWLNSQWGTRMVGVPYRGGGPIALAVAAGEIQLSNMGLGNFMGQIEAGLVRPLAVTTTRRSPLLPTVPTFAEAGLGGYQGRGWWGIAVPRTTPAAAVQGLNAAFVAVLGDPRFATFLERQAVEPFTSTPEEFANFLQEDRKAAEALVRIANTKPEVYRPAP
ncbi:Bug family tripartite tricarboxylate transporter substrate binding protein [Muricoccus aerilatus]|uniref:Bug family tripartite tricarboxylate transporter substrate binding protein n=1 Tax=Muricoccus aerilatus TaxID=452982 RepID=UPI0005C1ECD1|nr:tripartite tricarboxylate transporter substrate binding protein [Roseomonas aerilata]